MLLLSPGSLNPFALLAQQNWDLKINDDTPGGWLALVLYFVLAALCWVKYMQRRKSWGLILPAAFWFWLATGITGLGINKQADFHTWLISSGGRLARAEGIFEYRGPLQAAFVGLLALGAGAIASKLWPLARKADAAERLVIAGVVALLGFSLIRAASASHVDFNGAVPGDRTSLVGYEIAILVFLCFAVWCTPDGAKPDQVG
jgi:hypothetical protein